MTFILTRCLQGLFSLFLFGNTCVVTLHVGQLLFNSYIYMQRVYQPNSSSQLIYCEISVYLSNSECDILGRFCKQIVFISCTSAKVLFARVPKVAII